MDPFAKSKMNGAEYLDTHCFRKEDGHLRSVSDFGNYLSAFKDYYRERGVALPESQARLFENSYTGHKKRYALDVQAGKLPMGEGKNPLSFQSYLFLCRSLMSYHRVAFAHAYMIFCWNLVARSNTVASLHLGMFSWMTDHMTIRIPRHKGDQVGAHCTPKAVYANPAIPEACPIFALALHLLCTDYRPTTQQHGSFAPIPI